VTTYITQGRDGIFCASIRKFNEAQGTKMFVGEGETEAEAIESAEACSWGEFKGSQWGKAVIKQGGKQ